MGASRRGVRTVAARARGARARSRGGHDSAPDRARGRGGGARRLRRYGARRAAPACGPDRGAASAGHAARRAPASSARFSAPISCSATLAACALGCRYGATLSITETSEVLGNLTGGIHRGFEYDGLTTATFQLDTTRAFGWQGGTFDASALQIHGRNLRADNLLHCKPRAASRPIAPRACGSCGISRNSSPRNGSTSSSGSRVSIRNSWSARTRCCSSTPCSAGRWCRRSTAGRRSRLSAVDAGHPVPRAAAADR